MQTYFNTGRLVIHRITGADNDGFITRGDNRDADDPWRATNEIIRGEEWIHVPNAGSALVWLQEPWRLGALIAAVFLMGGVRKVEINRRRRHRMKRHFGTVESWLPARAELGANQATLSAFVAGAGAFALAFLVLGFFAFRSSSQAIEERTLPAYTETGTFDYEIQMVPSTLYPDGILRPSTAEGAAAGDADAPSPPSAFTSIAKEARLTFDYELQSEQPVSLEGTVSADLIVRPDGREWTRRIELLAPRPFDGMAASARIAVDLVSVGSLIETIETETGLAGRRYQLDVEVTVLGAGAHGDDPLSTEFTSLFTLQYDSVLVTPPVAMTTSTESATTERVGTSRRLPLGFWSPSVSLARTVSAVGFMAALGAVLISGGYLALALWTDEQARIRARYGSRLVNVEQAEAGRVEDAIRVASIRDLARLAERAGSVILHTPDAHGHRYFVRDGDDTYEYLVGDSEPVIGTTIARHTARKS
jgi:hypothetical protein